MKQNVLFKIYKQNKREDPAILTSIKSNVINISLLSGFKSHAILLHDEAFLFTYKDAFVTLWGFCVIAAQSGHVLILMVAGPWFMWT